MAEERDMDWIAMRVWEDSRRIRRAPVSMGMSMTFDKPSVWSIPRSVLAFTCSAAATAAEVPQPFPTSSKDRAGI